MGCVQSNLQDDGSSICATVDYEGSIEKVLVSPIESKTDELMVGSTALKNWIVELSLSSNSDVFSGCVLNLAFPGIPVRKVIVTTADKFISTNGNLYCTIAGNSPKELVFTNLNTANFDGLFILDVSNDGDFAEVGSDYWSAAAPNEEIVMVSIMDQNSEFSSVPVLSYETTKFVFSTRFGAKVGGPVCIGNEAANNLNIVGICSTSVSKDHYTAIRFNLTTFKNVYSKLYYLSNTYVQSKIDNDLYLSSRNTRPVNCWYGNPPTVDQAFLVYPIAKRNNELVVVLQSVNYPANFVGIHPSKTMRTLGQRGDDVMRYTKPNEVTKYGTFVVDSSFMIKDGKYYQLRSFRSETVVLEMTWDGKDGGSVRCQVTESTNTAQDTSLRLV